MTHVTCRLTTKNRDQLRNPTLGNRVWATFYTLSWSSVGMRMGINLSTPHTSKAPSTCQPASRSRTVTSGDWHRCNATLATREETARDRGLEREGGGRKREIIDGAVHQKRAELGRRRCAEVHSERMHSSPSTCSTCLSTVRPV